VRPDLAIEPALGTWSFLQFGAGPEMVEAGRRTARAALPALRVALGERVGWIAERSSP
jgi:hypothetical protein